MRSQPYYPYLSAKECKMPRLPYILDDTHPDIAELAQTIKSRRPGANLISLDRMLLNSPAYARGWNAMLGAVRKDLSLPLKYREMIICAVACLNDAPYQWQQHVPEWLRAGGTGPQVDKLQQGVSEALVSDLFDQTETALLALTIEMTLNVRVTTSTFERAKSQLPNDQVVEAVGTIAAYNMVSRFLVALEVE
jgi:alkylhydroperoxidase family enzyme